MEMEKVDDQRKRQRDSERKKLVRREERMRKGIGKGKDGITEQGNRGRQRGWQGQNH